MVKSLLVIITIIIDNSIPLISLIFNNLIINRYLRDKSNEPNVPSTRSPSVNDPAKTNHSSVEDKSDTHSLIDDIVRSSREVQDNLELDDDSKVLINRKLLAKVMSDHFKFYDILHRYIVYYIIVYHSSY